MTPGTNKKSGFVAIVGRPNVGKSTLLNAILGRKLSITSRKPQTTRHRIMGIDTQENVQTIYVDTPGIHQAQKTALNRYMNKSAYASFRGVDVVVMLVDATRWIDDDDFVLKRVKQLESPVILAINKIDKLKDKQTLLPIIENLSSKHAFTAVIPLSAKTTDQVSVLTQKIQSLLPEGELMFPKTQLTDKSDRFLAAEIVREKLMRFLGQEVPYALTVEIEEFKEEEKLTRISAVIYVERDGQKPIIIGEKGERLKKISTQARLDLEKLLSCKVFLRVWIKVKKNWSDDSKALKSLGYD